MAYKDPNDPRARERYKRHHEKMKREHPEKYAEQLRIMHERQAERERTDPEYKKHMDEIRRNAEINRRRNPEYCELKRLQQREYLGSVPQEIRDRRRQSVKASSAKHRDMRRIIFSMFKSSGCSCCGIKDEIVIDAHHIDPNTKSFGLAKAIYGCCSPKTFVLELAKCVPLCNNCHRKVHAGLTQCPTVSPCDTEYYMNELFKLGYKPNRKRVDLTNEPGTLQSQV